MASLSFLAMVSGTLSWLGPKSIPFVFLPYDVSWRSDYGSTACQGLQRGTSHQAAHLARVVVANHDDVPVSRCNED
jgi:hypothetical protein